MRVISKAKFRADLTDREADRGRRRTRGPDRLAEAEALPIRRPRGPSHHAPPPPPPVTLPDVSMGSVSDEDVGLEPDPIAQERAERYLRHVIAFRQREDADRRAARDRLFPGPTVHAEIPDDALVLVQPTDDLSPIEREILAELRRLCDRPPARWRIEANRDDAEDVRAAS